MGGSRDRVIVIGGGPVGLVAALALARAEVPVSLLERAEEPPQELRASTFHPPTLDLLAPFGLTARLIEAGLIADRWQIRDRESGPVATFDMAALADDTDHPYRVQCEQWKLSEFLLEALAREDVSLHYGAEAVAIDQDDSGVRVGVQGDDGHRSVEGAYAIVADGASSAMRRRLGIPFEGFTQPERFLLVSTPFPFDAHLADLTAINYVSDPREWLVLLRVPGLWRVLFPTSPGEDPDRALSDASIQERLEGVLPGLGPYPIAHRTLYPIHQRVAARYRRGRAFLAGDAAHVNNPLGGMGLNGGIHDALALAERIARVWRGDDPRLLDGYERMRRPIALDYVQQVTIRNQQLMEERDPVKRSARLAELRASAADPARAREVMLRASMISAVRESERLGRAPV